MFWNIFLILAGFVLLLIGAEGLVRGASSLAKRLSVPEIVIGLTVVAFGTSMPEMVVNVVASLGNKNDIVFGNIIGSNIFNLFLVLGLSALIYPLKVQKNTVWKEIPFSLLCTLVLFFLVNDKFGSGAQDNILARNDGLVLLAVMTIFLVYLFGISKVESQDEFKFEIYSYKKIFILILAGLTLLVVGGKLCVGGGVDLARNVGISEKIIGCTILAIGTSLPELATSVVAAFRRQCDIAVGNAIGSNIFNILSILGISSIITPALYSSGFNFDMLVLLAGTGLLLVWMFTGKKRELDRWEAVLFIIIYVFYVVAQIKFF